MNTVICIPCGKYTTLMGWKHNSCGEERKEWWKIKWSKIKIEEKKENSKCVEEVMGSTVVMTVPATKACMIHCQQHMHRESSLQQQIFVPLPKSAKMCKSLHGWWSLVEDTLQKDKLKFSMWGEKHRLPYTHTTNCLNRSQGRLLVLRLAAS